MNNRAVSAMSSALVAVVVFLSFSLPASLYMIAALVVLAMLVRAGALFAVRFMRRGLWKSEPAAGVCSCAMPSTPYAVQDGRLFCLFCRRETVAKVAR